jgi:hypothetical protein
MSKRTRRIPPACCARAASDHTAAALPSVTTNSRRRMWIAMRPSPGGHAIGGDIITPGRAALRHFIPNYVGTGVIRVIPLALACPLDPQMRTLACCTMSTRPKQ